MSILPKAKVILRICTFQIGVNIIGIPVYRSHIISDVVNKGKPMVRQYDYLK